MNKVFTLILLMIISLSARENPFFPSTGEADIPLTSNSVETLPALKRAAVTLPSTARTIESITIKYKDLDGSIHDKTEEIQNSVDWHLPIFVSQNIENTPVEAQTQTQIIPQSKESKPEVKKEYLKVASLKFISLYSYDKEIKIVTKDKMIRSFMLVQPHRIVCDFQRDIDIRSYQTDSIKKSIVTKVRIGNHKGYYRVVIELDGYYKHNVSNQDFGYTFNLK